MDEWIYPASLVVLAIAAFMLNQSHNSKLMLLTLAIGAYIVYSHETGYTATDFKNDTIKSINEDAEGWKKSNKDF